MDLLGSAASRSKLQQIKANLKQWEHEFQTQHSRAPCKADVQACASVQHLYRQYSGLKLKLRKESQDKENKVEENKIHVKSDPAEVMISKETNVKLFRLERNCLLPPQPASPSDDSSGSYVSSTPPKPVLEKCQGQSHRVAHSSGTRKPLQLLPLNGGNKIMTPLHSNPKCESGSTVARKSASKTVQVAPKKQSPNAAVGLCSNGAPHQKDLLPACPLALEGGLIIKLHRHGVQLDDRQSIPSDNPLPAGFFSSCGPSSLIKKDLESCSVISSEEPTARDGDSTSPGQGTVLDPSGHHYLENQGKIGDITEGHGFVLDQPQSAETVDTNQPITSSLDVCIEQQSKLVSDDFAVTNGKETSKASADLGDQSLTKGLLKTSVVVLKRMLLERGLPLTGNKSTLVTRLEKALLTNETGQPSSAEDMDMKFHEREQTYALTVTEGKSTNPLKKKASKGPEEQDEHIVKASTKRVKMSEPLEENSWANPRMLRKGARSQKGRSFTPSKHQRLCVNPGERDNFVKLNINGKGSKRRKFVNGTRTKRPGAYSGRGNRGAKFRKKNKVGTGDIGLADEGDETHQEGACKSAKNCDPAGSIWANDGWLETVTSPEELEERKFNNADELTARLKDAVDEIQKSSSEKNMTGLLRLVFGFKDFRAGQLEAIRRVLSLQSTMVILPTGAGKSLCYQLPAYLLPGIILVISPLMALMADQLRHLPPSLPGALISSAQDKGLVGTCLFSKISGPKYAYYVMSSLHVSCYLSRDSKRCCKDMPQTSQESSVIIGRLHAGEVKVLFISPERLFSQSFLSNLGRLPTISLAVIDEAHCLSEWSHNFRPSYFRLGRVLHQQMNVSCVLAMTATATKKTEQSILKSLCIPANGVVQASQVRQNLLLSVSRDTTRLKSLLSMLQSSPYAEAKSIIIYCAFQVETDNISGYLQQNGIQAKSYHSGKTSQERNRIYNFFCNNKLRVVVATVAFGMGLDKSDVRAIVHYNMPRTLESYVQETGRAGRDGNPAFCHLFLVDGDYLKLRSLAYSDGVDEYSVNKFLSRVFEGCSASTKPENLVSVIIETASRQLDMKEEVMETILSYLEVGEVEYVKVLSKLKATCTLSFHKSGLDALAGRSTFVAAITKRSKKTQGRYVFDLPCIATQLKLSLFDVQSELRRLQSAGEITYELSDLALCFRVLQIPADICLLTSTIATRLAEAEQCQVRKIDAMYMAATAAVNSTNEGVLRESNVSISSQQTSLQTSIKLYFEEGEDIPVTKTVPAIIKSNSSFVRPDIKVFLKSARNPNLTGRAVARIFHGLWSPAFPSSEWCKNHFWGLHAGVDFGVIKQAAAAEILAQHATNRNHFLP